MEEISQILKDENKLQILSKAAFNCIDTDKNGIVDLKELETMMKDMAAQLNIQSPNIRDIEYAFRIIDINKDKKISQSEFTAVIRKVLKLMIEN